MKGGNAMPEDKGATGRKVGGTILLAGIVGYVGFIGSLYVFPLFGFIAGLSALVLGFVAWLFFVFKLWGVSTPKKRQVGFGGIAGVLVLIIIISGAQHSAERALEQRRIQEVREQMQPGVSQELYLGSYAPFRSGSRVAMLVRETSTLRFSRTDMLPRLDGATALFPVYAAFVQAVYPELDFRGWGNDLRGYLREADIIVRCSTTGQAYENLINGIVDIIFVAGISEAHAEFARSKDIELEFTPIGKDAFVFFVHADNPVSALTTEQIRGIYSGRIRNWQGLGGENISIMPYQREANSGSQTALQYLMGDVPLMTPPMVDTIGGGGMEQIIERVEAREHRNQPNAIGYSFLFFATEMVRREQIRLLAIDGVYPSRENIANGTYPHSGYFYAVTVKGSDYGNPNISAFIEWILSEQGQYLIEKTGYTPLRQEN